MHIIDDVALAVVRVCDFSIALEIILNYMCKIDHNQTTTIHTKAWKVCIIFGIYLIMLVNKWKINTLVPERCYLNLRLIIFKLISRIEILSTWWRHQMDTFPCYWPFVRGIQRSPVNSPHEGQWCGAFAVFFDLHLNKRLSKQSRRWWFETPSRPLWRHCNDSICNYHQMKATRSDWWIVSIGSGKDLVPLGTKPLPEPVLTQICIVIWHHEAIMS